MAGNPMQRKSRNSFLLGIIVALLISSIAIVILFLQINKKDQEIKNMKASTKKVYVLNEDVESGQILTQDMFSIKEVNSDSIPSDATAMTEVIESWFLQTSEGDMVQRDSKGLFIDSKGDSIIELFEVTAEDVKDAEGLEVGQYYRIENGEKIATSVRGTPYNDNDGYFVVDSNNEDTKTRIYPEVTGGYYCYRLDTSTNTRVKTEINMSNVGMMAKVGMKKNTVMTRNLVQQTDNPITSDVRKEEYNMMILPTDLMTDDYIDIRLRMPNGQNFIVVSKKQVTIPTTEDGSYIADTIWVNLNEAEILMLSSAIVEAYGVPGGQIYVNKYVEAGMQDAATPTYYPNNGVIAQINSNPNIVERAKAGLRRSLTEEARNVRQNYLQSQIDASTTYDVDVSAGMDESADKSETSRKRYLDSLGSAE